MKRRLCHGGEVFFSFSSIREGMSCLIGDDCSTSVCICHGLARLLGVIWYLHSLSHSLVDCSARLINGHFRNVFIYFLSFFFLSFWMNFEVTSFVVSFCLRFSLSTVGRLSGAVVGCSMQSLIEQEKFFFFSSRKETQTLCVFPLLSSSSCVKSSQWMLTWNKVTAKMCNKFCVCVLSVLSVQHKYIYCW